MIFLMGKKAIIYIIFASWILISCKTPRLLHYASEISDSTFIYLYLQNSALPSDDKETTGRLSEYNDHDIIGYYYLCWIRGDSLYLDDQVTRYDPWPIKKNKDQITIYRNNNKEGLFYGIENIDSIVLRQVSKSYLLQMNEKYHKEIY